MDPSESVKYSDSTLCILTERTWYTSMVMSPEELSFLYATERGGPKQGMEGAMIGQLQRTD